MRGKTKSQSFLSHNTTFTMGYNITLARQVPKREITESEWREFVLAHPELTPVHRTATDGSDSFNTAILDGCDDLCLHYAGGTIFTQNPEGPRIIEYMASIAPHFDGIVTGDEGEIFSTAADWGPQSQWNQPTPRKSFWKRELTPGNIIRMTILLLFAVAWIYRYVNVRQ